MNSKLLDMNKNVILSFRLSIEDTLRLERGDGMTIKIKDIPFTIKKNGDEE